MIYLKAINPFTLLGYISILENGKAFAENTKVLHSPLTGHYVIIIQVDRKTSII